MCDMTQVQLRGIVEYYQRVAWGIHHQVGIERDPEEKSSFGTYNPSLVVQAGRDCGFRILDKGEHAYNVV
jgi:hypothetical protein